MRYVVTLLHGTFAKDAPWTQEGSLLRIGLEQLLHGPVEFRCVEWSGRNTVAARAEGAEKLVRELRRQMEDRHATLFIIAHSHGGNVALYAMHDDAIRSRVAGLVTIATPFIVASPRLSVAWDFSFLVAGFVVYILMLNLSPYSWFSPHLSVAGGVAVQTVLFGLLFAPVIPFLNYLENRSDTLLKALRLPRMEYTKLLILRSAGDETSVVLVVSQFLAFIPYRLYTAGLALTEFLSGGQESQSRIGARRLLELFATAASGLLVGPLIIAAWMSQVAFNFDFRANNPFINVTAEAKPPGEWRVHLFVEDRIEIPHAGGVVARARQLKLGQRDPSPRRGPNSLTHSHLYSHWQALQTIAKWMASQKE